MGALVPLHDDFFFKIDQKESKEVKALLFSVLPLFDAVLGPTVTFCHQSGEFPSPFSFLFLQKSSDHPYVADPKALLISLLRKWKSLDMTHHHLRK